MAFLPSSSTKTLYAYLTQKGREYVLSGDQLQFKITQFSLHDDDVNYNVTKTVTNDEYNKLPKGFVPDITGDDDDCVTSIAAGVYVNLGCRLTGDTSGLLKQTRDIYIGFNSTSYNAPAPTNISQNNFSDSTNLRIALSPPENDPNSITNEELAGSNFFIVVTVKSQAITNVKINGTANQSPIITFTTSPSITLSLTFDKDNTIATKDDRVLDSKIEFQLVPSGNALLKSGFDKFTYNIPLTIKGTGAGSSG
jgi:hypothetical protein